MTKRTKAAAILATVVAAASPVAALADLLAQWNFNTSTAPTFVQSHFGSTPTVSLVGGVTGTLASGSGSSDPAQPGQAYNLTNFPAQSTANKTAGAEYDFNTTNYDLTSFTFDLRTSNTSSRNYEVQYSTDGSTWVDDGLPITATVFDGFNNGNTVDLTSIPQASDNSNFRIRVVAAFSPTGFTDGTATYGDNSAYLLAESDDATKSYKPTGTWRFDMVTLNGTYNAPNFTPANLTWNTSSGTWDTTTHNWSTGIGPTNYAQLSGQGDNVTFNNPANNSIVTIQASGVTPDSITITNNNTLTLTGGSISGSGGLNKSGIGRLIMASSNSFTGVSTPTTITAGSVETRANNALGSGPVSIGGTAGNVTWNSTTTSQTFGNVVTLAGPATFDTTTDLTIGALAGSGTFSKIGNGTLGIAGIGTDTGDITITAGTVRMDNMGALGGNATPGVIAPPLTITNANLVFNGTGNGTTGARPSVDIHLNNVTMSRNQLTPTLGPSPTNGDSELTAYTTDADLNTVVTGGIFTVVGNSTIVNNETRTAATSDKAGGNGSSNEIVIRMPMVISTSATLTLDPTNSTISTVGGVPTGDLSNTGIALRGPAVQGINDNDSVTLQHGSTLVLTGASQKRIGSSSIGKPIIGFGTPGSESVIKADANTYMTDAALAGSNNTMLVVSGTGSAGLRIEAPMNATYDSTTNTYTSGLFGVNPDTSDTSVGNSYTILSPNRYAGLSGGYADMPANGADGQPITLGGMLTVAATDAAGATGVIDNGPAAPCAVTLALDNTATSGNLVYSIDPTVNPGTISNFAGLAIKRSHTTAGSVTAVVAAGTLAVSSLAIDPTAKLDVASNKLVVAGGTLGSWNGINYDGITGLIKSGRNAGNWNGGGIITSMTAAKLSSHLTTLAVATAGDVGYGGTQTFGGQNVNASDVLVMYTYAGDANLNGSITGDDYARIDQGFASHGAMTGYENGDFNYDGKINADDYFLIDRNYGLQNSFSLGGAPALSGVSAVPEPSGAAIVMMGILAASRRRKRNQRPATIQV